MLCQFPALSWYLSLNSLNERPSSVTGSMRTTKVLAVVPIGMPAKVIETRLDVPLGGSGQTLLLIGGVIAGFVLGVKSSFPFVEQSSEKDLVTQTGLAVLVEYVH